MRLGIAAWLGRGSRREARGELIDRLVRDADRGAARTAAIARTAVAALLLGLFLAVRPPGLPAGFVAFATGALLLYLALGAATLWFASSPLFRPGRALLLTGLDAGVYAGVLVGEVTLVGLPAGLHAATPPFLVAFLLLALGALRYSLAPLLLTAGVTSAAALGLVLIQEASYPEFAVTTASGLRLPMFEPGANVIRLALLAMTAGVLALVVARARERLIEALELGERAAGLSRYLPAPVAQLVASEGVGTLARGEVAEASVLFADMVGFTALAERTGPAELSRLLTGLRRLQREAIEGHGGFVDKFIGDAVMGVFGPPGRDPAAAANALAAALAMREAIARWNDERRSAGESPIAVGIGLHHGPVFAGAVGDEARLEFAVLGDAVNIAQRCERLTRELGEPLLVTRPLLDAAGAGPAGWRSAAIRALPGRRGEVELLAPA